MGVLVWHCVFHQRSVYISLTEQSCVYACTCTCRWLCTPVSTIRHNFSHHLCVAVSLFPNGAFHNGCRTRKRIIVKSTQWSSDNTEDLRWHINTVEGQCTITVYGPAPAQLPPLKPSIITTPSRALPVTLDLFTPRLCNNAAKKSPVYGTFVFHSKEGIAIIRRPRRVLISLRS